MSSKLQGSYDQLMERSKRLTILRSATGIIYWDMETKMPPKGIAQRSEQLSLLDVISHNEMTDKGIPSLLDKIEKDKRYSDLGKVEKRNVSLFRKAYNEEAKLPEDLVAATSKQSAITVAVWKKAKAAQDYNMFKPELAKMIELRKRAADIMMKVKGTKTPYDAMLDSFEPGMNAEKITEIFNGMRKGLISVMKKVGASDIRPDIAILSRKVPVEAQRKIGQMAMDFIGYDTVSDSAGGRLDETEHPFSTGYYDDVRITTHYHEDRYASSLFSVLHEGGHALYEQNMPQEWKYLPVGAPSSYGIHESQSRFVENIIGRSPEFLEAIMPKLKKVAPSALRGVKLNDFISAVNHVEPSKVRIEADEVTYGLHIIIRFEMERDIFSGKLDIDELPQAWNEKYAKYLGVKIENDSEGVMQDTHWAGGAFGYFPSYALGNIYGGMFLGKMEKDMPGWEQGVRKGDFSNVRNWLVDNVHSKANLYDPSDLIKELTGKDLDIKPFINYLNEKMGRIYGF
jgi:carboxypeptidase Taq